MRRLRCCSRPIRDSVNCCSASAQVSALFYSLLGTAKLRGLAPVAFLHQALIAILQDGALYAIKNPLPGGKPSFLITEEASQFADSSRSMAAYFEPLRLTGAAIRLVFLRAAALKLGGAAADYEAREHKVRHKATGRTLDYVDLLLPARKVKVPSFCEIQAGMC